MTSFKAMTKEGKGEETIKREAVEVEGPIAVEEP